MKIVTCHKGVSRIEDANGKNLPKATVKAPEKGQEYRVTGQYRANGCLYYFLMGFGIKIAFKETLFQAA